MSPLAIILILGLVQGLCEFLPVSSSGHLVLAQAFLGLREPEVLLDLVLHLGTLLAVLVFYRQSLAALARELRFIPSAILGGRLVPLWRGRPDFRLGLLIVLGSVPTAAIGLLAHRPLEALFGSVRAVGLALLATALVLVLTRLRRTPGLRTVRLMTAADALIIGTVQGLAIAPGLSRSGLTIACALLLGLDRELAARYSFLLSIPAILGGLALSLAQGQASSLPPWLLLAGLAVSAVTGYLSLRLLAYIVDRGRLPLFAPWCLLVGLAALLLPLG